MNVQELQHWRQTLRNYLQQVSVQDGAHDISHFDRVWNNCCYICDTDDLPADRLVLLAASYFHDIV